MTTKKCTDCGDQPLHLYSKNAAGDYRAKCDICINNLKPTHRLQQAKPAPSDAHPLPKIVAQAMGNEGEIETIGGMKVKLKSRPLRESIEVASLVKCYVCQHNLPIGSFKKHDMTFEDGITHSYREATCENCMKKIRNSEEIERKKEKKWRPTYKARRPDA